MKTNERIRPARRALATAVASIGLSMAPAFAATPTAPRAGGKVGLAAALADEERVLGEIATRDEMSVLRDHMFKKLNLNEEQKAAYLAVNAVKKLEDPALKPGQRAALIKSIVGGIDRVLVIQKDPARLMALNRSLVELGTMRLLNISEYWPESPARQADLRPVAEAVDKVYAQAAKLAEEKAKQIENQITAANQNTLGPQWEKMEELTHLAKFSRGMNLYTLALSIDKADPNRAKVVAEGIKLIEPYESGFQLDAQVKMAIGKLSMVGGPATVENAKKKFAEVLALPDAAWPQKFEANYFTAVTDVYGRKLDAAKQGKAALEKWLAANPFQGPKEGINAAVDMLEYRIRNAEADAAPAGPAQEKAKLAAMDVLVKLEKEQPALRPIIREQMVAQLPANPDVKTLPPLLLGALVARGEAEVLKAENAPVDDKAVAQGVLAAREMIARKGQEGVSAENVENAQLLLGFMFRRQNGMHVPAANAFMDFIERHPRSVNLRLAYENAASELGRALQAAGGQPETLKAHRRFLEIATAPPFNDARFNLEFAQMLVKDVLALPGGQAGEAQVKDLQKSAQLAQQIKEPNRILAGRFTEMMALDQLLELDPKNAATYLPRATALADEINKLAAAPAAGQEATAKLYKVRTNILAANLAKHASGAEKKRSMERALELLASFEKDVEGMPNAKEMIGNVRYIRVSYLMQLGRATEALDDLAKFVEAQGDSAIDVIVEMLQALDKEFEVALKNDRARAQELAANRAQVAKFLTDTAQKAKNPKVIALIPQFRGFEAKAAMRAADLETDPAKRRQFLDQALKFYEEALEKKADDPQAQLNVALIHFELGNFEKAQPPLAQLVLNKQLGKPIDVVVTADGQQTKWNDLYWSAQLKLIQCNLKLIEQKKPGFGAKELEETKTYLQRVFIQWGEPGGPKFYPEFKKLKDQLLPGWNPPGDAAPTTQPAPATAGK